MLTLGVLDILSYLQIFAAHIYDNLVNGLMETVGSHAFYLNSCHLFMLFCAFSYGTHFSATRLQASSPTHHLSSALFFLFLLIYHCSLRFYRCMPRFYCYISCSCQCMCFWLSLSLSLGVYVL